MEKIVIILIVVIVLVVGMGELGSNKSANVLRENTSVLSAVGQSQVQTNQGVDEIRSQLPNLVNALRGNTAAIESLQASTDAGFEDVNHKFEIVDARLDGLEQGQVLSAIAGSNSNRINALPPLQKTICQISGSTETYPCHQDASGNWVKD